MRFSYFKLALGVGVLSLVGWGLPGCGSSSSGGSGGTGGGSAGTAGTGTGGSAGTGTGGSAGSSGGSAGADGGLNKTCGTASCTGASVAGIVNVNACCPPTPNTCGLDTKPLQTFGFTFNPVCQPKNQPGNLDSSCSDFTISPVTGVTLTLKGCCRPAGQCGYMANTIDAGTFGTFQLGMGCVDSTPFLEGGAPKSCTPSDAGPSDAGDGG